MDAAIPSPRQRVRSGPRAPPAWQLRTGGVLQERGIPSRARHPFQGGALFRAGRRYRWVPLPGHEEAPPRPLSLLVIAGAPAAMAHSHWPARHVEAQLPRPVPLGGGRSFRWATLRGMARHQCQPCSGRDSCTFPGQLHLPGTAAPSPRAFTFLRVHLPMASLLERRVPDGGVAAVTRGWGQPLSWDSRGRYDSDHFDVRRLIY